MSKVYSFTWNIIYIFKPPVFTQTNGSRRIRCSSTQRYGFKLTPNEKSMLYKGPCDPEGPSDHNMYLKYDAYIHCQ